MRVFILTILLLLNVFAFAFDSIHYTELKFSHLNSDKGLAHNNVECILKDSEGFVWIGTRNGLCRFDGYEVKTYSSSPTDTNSLSGNRILSLAEDKQGNLWIGTYNNGLNKLDKRTNRITRYSQIVSGSNVHKIKVFADSSIWFCTNNGLAKYTPANHSFVHFHSQPQNPESLNSEILYDIIETRKGEIYVATDHQMIQRFNPGTNSFENIGYKRDYRLGTNYKKSIVEDNNGILWITANVHGLCSYNPENGQSEIYTQFDGSLPTNILMGSTSLDKQGNLWISTDGAGITVFNPNTLKYTSITKTSNEWSLSSNHVYVVYFDSQNFIWIGTFDEGVNYFDPDRFKFSSSLFQPNDLNFFRGKSVLSIFQDSKNRIWVGTDGNGLYRIEPDRILKEYHYKPGNENSLSTEVIKSINEDQFGNILLGTYAGGFMILNPETNFLTRIYQGDINQGQLGSNSIWYILRDSQSRIWLGLLGMGLDLYNAATRKFSNYGPMAVSNEKIDFPNVMTIMESNDGDLWFGTEGKGVYILDRQTAKIRKLSSDSLQQVIAQSLIKCFFQDKWGQIWIGTEGNGVFVYNEKTQKLKQYSYESGLSSNIIESIIEDSHGSVWMGTSRGLNVFDPNTNMFRTYLTDDGLSGNIFNQGVMIMLNDGRIMTGTTKGLDVFKPEAIIANPILPNLVFTSFKILNQEVEVHQAINKKVVLATDINYTKEISLNYRDKSFSLSFAALNYTLPEKCQYAYLMEGFDDDWVCISSDNRTASYTNLPAGVYTFKVKASNNDGKWGNNIREIKVRILPPFYQTIWFKSTIVFLLLFLLYLAYRYRLNSIRNNFLEKQFIQEKRIIELEKEQLDSELQKLTFHVLNRNRELIDQKNRLLGLSAKAKESVRIGLQDIIAKMDEELSDDKDWKYIEPQLDKVYSNFVSRLKEKHPDLSLSEIKIAAYLRMNLTTKEISEFMHKTTRAIENDRYRLRKKIGLDINDSLKAYLNNL
ncbi:MAG: hypothetical protein IPM71_11535 [Bacteroidota bacterium]|nr:MAG: hypothetical protein IPM71_11535 [Bacteroidota bacterium]